MKTEIKPWFWIPFLNFASGFPYAIIISVSVIMYKNLGVNNEDIGIYTSLLFLPWVMKPLWSPFIDLHGTKRKWFLGAQLLISIAFLLVGLTIHLTNFFVVSLAIFFVAAFSSATNDVASDGYYMLALAEEQQSFFLGIKSSFYKLSILTGQGLIVILAGYLEQEYGDKTKAWSYTMILVALIMIVLTLYNYFSTSNKEIQREPIGKVNFGSVFRTFFEKKQIGLILAFIMLFRLGESQLLKMLAPFLIDPKKLGGMGLTTQDVGMMYGTFGVIGLTAGGILGGFAISKNGLKKWMLPMILIMRLPIIGFVLLAHFLPNSIYYVYITVILEQLGYGFGFVAFLMFLIYVAEGESKTSHFAIATGFMALGMMLPGMLSGYIQSYLGYTNFFIWVIFTTIPSIIISRFLIYPATFGKKIKIENLNL